MNCHVQYTEQLKSPSNFTEYCACHEMFKLKISAETPWIASADIKRMRRHSEDLSRISDDITRISDDKIVISRPPVRRPDSSHLGDAFCMNKYNISRSGYLPKFHELLRLPRKVTLQLHQIPRLPRKMNLMIDTGIYSLHLFSLGIFSVWASILFWHLFSLGIYSLWASFLSGHLFSLGIYSLWASFLSWHLFSLDIYSLLFWKLRNSEVSHPNFLWSSNLREIHVVEICDFFMSRPWPDHIFAWRYPPWTSAHLWSHGVNFMPGTSLRPPSEVPWPIGCQPLWVTQLLPVFSKKQKPNNFWFLGCCWVAWNSPMWS